MIPFPTSNLSYAPSLCVLSYFPSVNITYLFQVNGYLNLGDIFRDIGRKSLFINWLPYSTRHIDQYSFERMSDLTVSLSLSLWSAAKPARR